MAGRRGRRRLLPRRPGAAMCAAVVGERGGRVTEEDLAAYRVIQRRPVRAAYRGTEFVSNPPPSSGGLLIAFALRILDRLGPMPERRERRGDRRPRRGHARGGPGSAAAPSSPSSTAAGRPVASSPTSGSPRPSQAARSRARVPAPESSGVPSTTHISVVDADGNAASLSASTGCGSGFVVPGTGIQLNNMLGEPDLNPPGGPPRPGDAADEHDGAVDRAGRAAGRGSSSGAPARSACAPPSSRSSSTSSTTASARGGGDRGAARPPRRQDVLQLEGGTDPAAADASWRSRATTVTAGPAGNLYFGGAAAVAVREDGELEAAGDPRRGGAGVVVGA